MRIDKKLRQEVLLRDGEKCLLCGSTDRLTMDHIKPLSHGGLTTLSNLQTLCQPCNVHKANNNKDYRRITFKMVGFMDISKLNKWNVKEMSNSEKIKYYKEEATKLEKENENLNRINSSLIERLAKVPIFVQRILGIYEKAITKE